MWQFFTVTGASIAFMAQGKPPRYYNHCIYYKKSGYLEKQCFKKYLYLKKKFDRKKVNYKRRCYNSNKNAIFKR